MKKFLTLIMVLVLACSTLGLFACDNDFEGILGDDEIAGVIGGEESNGEAGETCKHSVNAQGVCTLCGKDILAKWKTVFNNMKENYDNLWNSECTMKVVTDTERNIYENGEVIRVDKVKSIEITKYGKNKIYEKRYYTNLDGSIYKDPNDNEYERYYEYLPEENTVMCYKWDNDYYFDWETEEETGAWVKYIDNNIYVDSLYNDSLLGLVEPMVPTKIEYKDNAFYVTYSFSLYGDYEIVYTFKDNLLTHIDAKNIDGDDEDSVSIDITYGNTDIVFPEAILIENPHN